GVGGAHDLGNRHGRRRFRLRLGPPGGVLHIGRFVGGVLFFLFAFAASLAQDHPRVIGGQKGAALAISFTLFFAFFHGRFLSLLKHVHLPQELTGGVLPLDADVV